MARIKFGMMMTDARGKLGGQVFTKTRSGATVRTKVTPVNLKSSAQALVRNRFGSLSQGWRGLSESDRRSWNNAVENFKKTNVFGDQYAPSGKNLYQGLNTNILTAGGNVISTPPLPDGFGSFSLEGFILNKTLGSFLIESANEFSSPGTQQWVIEATQPYSAGRFNFSGSYRVINTIYKTNEDLTDSAVTGDLYADYVFKFGHPAIGTKVSVRLSAIDPATGIATPRATLTSIVV